MASNIEFLADIWAAAAIILGRHEDVLPETLDAARKRPAIVGLQTCLEQIAVQCGRFDLALEAIDRQPVTAQTVLRKVAILHQAKRYSECVELMQSKLESLPRDNPMLPVCLSLALLSAEQTVKENAAKDFYSLFGQIQPGLSIGYSRLLSGDFRKRSWKREFARKT